MRGLGEGDVEFDPKRARAYDGADHTNGGVTWGEPHSSRWCFNLAEKIMNGGCCVNQPRLFPGKADRPNRGEA